MVIVFNFGPFYDFKASTAKKPFNTLNGSSNGVQATGIYARAPATSHPTFRD